MVSIPIANETPYTLTDAMRQDILHDAQEHFGDTVRSIRVQEGLERHVFNARTHQVRYAFSPTDFGLVRLSTPATTDYGAALPPRQEDVRDEETLELRATLLEDFEGRDADAQEDDVFTLDKPVEEDDEDEEEGLLDEEDEE